MGLATKEEVIVIMASDNSRIGAALSTTENPARDAAAMAVIRQHGLYPRRLPNGSWQAVQTAPGHSGDALETATYSDPVEALESALAALQEAESKARTSHLSRLFDALARGAYVPWPETLANGALEFRVLRVSDRQLISVHTGLLPALVEIARLTNEPVLSNSE